MAPGMRMFGSSIIPMDGEGKQPELSGNHTLQEFKQRVETAIRQGCAQGEAALSAEHQKEHELMPARVSEIIALIESKVVAVSEWCVERGVSLGSDGSRCAARVMELRPLEFELYPNTFLAESRYEKPEPSRLRYAAKQVFEYCEKAGLNPKLEHVSYKFPTPAKLYLHIRWNLPERSN